MIYYFAWTFVILMGVIIFELLGKTQEVIGVTGYIVSLVIEFIK